MIRLPEHSATPRINFLQVDRALYRLLTSFLASPRITELRSDTSFDAFTQIIDQNQTEEIMEALIFTAISTRVIFDLDKIQRREWQEVGSLTTKGKASKLYLKEACNKIIHAGRLDFDIKKNEANLNYLNPTIHLFGVGQDRKTPWEANLNIEKYVEAAHTAHF